MTLAKELLEKGESGVVLQFLAQCCKSSRLDQRADQYWLTDMRHAHLVGDEVDEFFV